MIDFQNLSSASMRFLTTRENTDPSPTTYFRLTRALKTQNYRCFKTKPYLCATNLAYINMAALKNFHRMPTTKRRQLWRRYLTQLTPQLFEIVLSRSLTCFSHSG